MNLRFKRVKLVNFLSYKGAEIDLQDKGFCGLIGVNKYKLDNSGSNGSGKSTIISAISYVLTGETVQGIKKDLKNKYAKKSEESYVELEFNLDSHSYIIKRSETPKGITIIYDGEDVSGKTKTDSEERLGEYIPNLNKKLLNSIILLGQNLPDKFSGLTAVKRKESLEELLQIDELYTELNEKVNHRISIIKNELGNISTDKKIWIAQEAFHKGNLEKSKLKLANLNFTQEDEIELRDLSENLPNIEKQLSELEDKYLRVEEEKSKLEKSKEEILNEFKINKVKKESDFKINYNSLLQEVNYKNKELKRKKKEIDDLQTMKICPTCGQEIKPKSDLGAHKGPLEAEISKLNETLVLENKELEKLEESYKKEVNELESKYKTDALDNNINNVSSELEVIAKQGRLLRGNFNEERERLVCLKTLKNSFSKDKQSLEKEIEEYEKALSESDSKINTLNNKESEFQVRLESIKDIGDCLKKEFRSYLIKDTVNKMNEIAKDYCYKIFNNKEIEIELSENSIEIYFQDKNYFSLSGGEKQKIDLIIQFTLRKILEIEQGLKCNVLFLDEIFDNLDIKGVNEIVNFISTELSDIESVFIISHHSEELGLEYDTRYSIVKEEDGISTLHLMN